MAGLKIDLDRGILYEVSPERRPRGGVTHKQDPVTNAMVFMYKDDPGVYYSANGVRVSETLAKRAGFEVDRHSRERDKKLKVKEFEAKYQAQLQDETRVVVKERGQYRLVKLPNDRYIVEDMDGENQTKGVVALTEVEGLGWLTDFAGPEEEANVNVRTADDAGKVGTDRRSPTDGSVGGDVGKSGRPKVAIPA